MMEISDTYVRITGYLIQEINIHWCRIYSPHYMLDLPVLNAILIDTQKQEIFPTLMLEDSVYITHPLK